MMQQGAFAHIPVMPVEVLDALQVKPGGTYADGTLGGGGHAALILRAAQPGGTLYGIDRDPAALHAAGERLAGEPGFHPIHGNFHDVKELLAGITLDCWIWGYPPTSWTRRSAVSATMRKRRWTCAWTPPRG